MPAGPAVVSGGAGFVGRHLVERLRAEGVECLAPDKDEVDLLDAGAVRALIRDCRPAAIYHLAAHSSPSVSLRRPTETLLQNWEMTVNLLEAARAEALGASIVLVGSSQVYGDPDPLPAEEDSPLRPTNPYAASKAACDLLGAQYAAAYGLGVRRMRPFNHAGPGQSEEYVISSLARQVAAAEVAGEAECVLRTGNPQAARDFTDVRDVVRAYVAAAAAPPNAYNVCAGRAATVAELVAIVARQARVAVRHEVDPGRLRADDAPLIYGSARRLAAACGWRPEIPLERTLGETLEWWRGRLGRASSSS